MGDFVYFSCNFVVLIILMCFSIFIALFFEVDHRENVILDYDYLFIELLNQINWFWCFLVVGIEPDLSEVGIVMPPLIDILSLLEFILHFS